MGVGQIEGAAIGAQGQAIGHDEVVQQQPGALARRMAVEPSGRRALGHVLHHSAHQEPALAIAATVVASHGRLGMVEGDQAFAAQLAVSLGLQGEEAAFQTGEPAATLAGGDAGEHFRCAPAVQGASRGPAVQPLGGDIDPVERLFGDVPDRALAGGVAGIDEQFGGHGGPPQSSKGPVATKAPPW